MALLSLYGAYLVAMNAFLSTSLFEKVVGREPETIDIHYRHGWSLWPARVHAKELSIRGRDSNIEWVLTLDEADFDVDLLALAKMTFIVPRVHGRGIAMRVRSRLETPPKSPDDVAGLPPLPGLPPWTLKPADVDHSDYWSDESYALWTAHLERIDAEDVREIWIDKVRFQGRAHAKGRFFFKPIRVVDIGPASVRVDEGRVERAGVPLVERLAGTFDVRVRPLDPRVSTLADLLHHSSLSTALAASVPDVGALPLPEGVAGRLDLPRVELRVDNGVLRAPSRLEARADDATLRRAEDRVTGAFALTADVHDREGAARLDADLALRALTMTTRGATLLQIPDAHLRVDARGLDLADPLPDLHARIELPHAAIPDAAALSRRFASNGSIAVHDGAGHAHADVELWRSEGKCAGSVGFHAERLALRRGNVGVRTTLDARASVASFLWREHRAEGVTVALENATSELLDDRGAALLAFDATVKAQASAVDLEDPARSLRFDVEVPRVRVEDPNGLSALVGTSSPLRFTRAQGRASMTARGEVRDHRASMNLEARADDLEVHGAKAGLRFTARAKVRVHDGRWAEKSVVLDEAVLDVPRLALVRAGASAPRPLGEIHVRAASPRLTLAEPWKEIDAQVQAHVGDASALQQLMPADSLFRIDAGDLTLRGRARLSKASRRGIGDLDVTLERAALGFQETTLAGDFHVTTRLTGYDPEHDVLTLAGTQLALRNIQARGATTETNAWRGDVALRDTKLRLDPYVELEGDMSLDADDARAFLAILMRKDLPKVLAGIAEMPNVHAQAHVTAGARRVAVRGFEAKGGDFRVRGLYGARDASERGALILEKGPISAGVLLDDRGTSVRLFGLEGWLDEQSRAVVRLVDGGPPEAPRKAKGR